MQEFVTRGDGTPVPFDPPRRVTRGIYAYIGDPMQLAAVLLLLRLGVYPRQPVGRCGRRDGAYLLRRHCELGRRRGPTEHGSATRGPSYRRSGRARLPRFRPWYATESRRPVFWCRANAACARDVSWTGRAPRRTRIWRIVAAEDHPSGGLTVSPKSGRRCLAVSGIEAIGRALEHVHLGWAIVGCAAAPAGRRPWIQVIVDASGGQPRASAPRSFPIDEPGRLELQWALRPFAHLANAAEPP